MAGVDLLIVDIEGQDDAVIMQYFAATPKLSVSETSMCVITTEFYGGGSRFLHVIACS